MQKIVILMIWGGIPKNKQEKYGKQAVAEVVPSSSPVKVILLHQKLNQLMKSLINRSKARSTD